ncbi:MAG: polymerase polymerase protein [Candidatus Berkelbacteria bacterium]|nr:polymerase polymerase protein [Candidatus Berkelbacteria bacterium]
MAGHNCQAQHPGRLSRFGWGAEGAGGEGKWTGVAGAGEGLPCVPQGTRGQPGRVCRPADPQKRQMGQDQGLSDQPAGIRGPPKGDRVIILIDYGKIYIMIKDRFVLIDAFALIFRAYHAIPPMTNSKGVQLNAVYGFTSALLSSIQNLHPEYLAVGFDLAKPTKRHIEFKEYKAHRPPAPPDLSAQIPYVKEVLKVFNIPTFAVEGYEGEDVIASIIAKIRNPKAEILNKSQILNSNSLNAKRFTLNPTLEFIIVTGDMDCLQLIDNQTKVYSMARGRRPEGALPGGVNQATLYDAEKVKERYGLLPSQFVDFKALKGDASDNIPGVPGIGEKTAASLIQNYNSLEELYQAINPKSEARNPKQIPNEENEKKLQKNAEISERLHKILLENKEQAFLSQKLSKIDSTAPIDFRLEDAKIHDYDQKKITKLFEEYGFRSLIKRLPEEKRENSQQKLL